MLSPVVNPKDVLKLRDKLYKQLSTISGKELKIRHVAPGGNPVPMGVKIAEKLHMWWFLGKTNDTKLWCAYGLEQIQAGKTYTARCQINFSLKGFNRRISGLFATDSHGKIYVLHDGGVGGGIAGVGKEQYCEFATAEQVEVGYEGKVYPYFVVGVLGQPDFPESLKSYVQSVYDFKESIDKSKSSGSTSKTAKKNPLAGSDLSTYEYAGIKKYNLPERQVTASNQHALVFRALKESLRHFNPKRDKNRDLFIRNDAGIITHLFEIKSSPSLQAVYTAIGQLMLRSVEDKATCIIVLPDETNKELIKDLAKLKIKIVTFSFDTNNQVHFKGLKNIINA